MAIVDTVNANIVASQAWATSARDAAREAMNALVDVDYPYPTVGGIGYEPLQQIQPEKASPPSPISLSNAPIISQIEDIIKPDRPDLPSVVMGELLSISIPDVPIIEFPVLTIEPPKYTISQPKNWEFEIGDILITDDPLIQASILRLKNNIEHGGTGLSADVESAIWDRDLERNEQALRDATDKIAVMWAKKGFSLPDGLLANSLSDIQKEYLNKRLDRSREIAVKQAELEQTNIFKSLDLAINLAFKLVDANTRYAELVFKGQEATAKFANEYVSLQIQTYQSLLEAYKATAQVHETMVRAQIAKVELYKAQIEGQQAIMGINEQTVKIYSEELRATVVLMDRYKTEIDAMVAFLGSEKAKVEVNKLQMDAWAKNADVILAKYSGQIDMFKAQSQVNISTAELTSKVGEANLRASLSYSELVQKQIEANNRIDVATAGMRMEAAKAVAQHASTMAAGAMAGVTSGSSMSYGESRPMKEGA